MEIEKLDIWKCLTYFDKHIEVEHVFHNDPDPMDFTLWACIKICKAFTLQIAFFLSVWVAPTFLPAQNKSYLLRNIDVVEKCTCSPRFSQVSKLSDISKFWALERNRKGNFNDVSERNESEWEKDNAAPDVGDWKRNLGLRKHCRTQTSHTLRMNQQGGV